MNPTRATRHAALLLALTSAALAAQNPNQPQNPQGPGGGVQPMAACQGDCDPPPPANTPPVVTIVTPSAAKTYTRTPLILILSARRLGGRG